jgi:hypothetical protein
LTQRGCGQMWTSRRQKSDSTRSFSSPRAPNRQKRSAYEISGLATCKSRYGARFWSVMGGLLCHARADFSCVFLWNAIQEPAGITFYDSSDSILLLPDFLRQGRQPDSGLGRPARPRRRCFRAGRSVWPPTCPLSAKPGQGGD